MRTNKVSQVSFNAYLPVKLKNKLFEEAYRKGSGAVDCYTKQVKNLEKWGLETSALTEIEEKEGSNALALFNSYNAPFRKFKFPKKDTILDTFLSLTEKDITDAEYTFRM